MTEQPGRFQVCFRGVRGSHSVLHEPQSRFGHATTCCEILAGGHQIILDAGGGIIPLGEEMARAHAAGDEPSRPILFLTHTHYDHVSGLPFFQPIYHASTSMWLAGPTTPLGGVETAMQALFHPFFHPVGWTELMMQRTCVDLSGGEAFVLRNGDTAPMPLAEGIDAGAEDVVIRTVFNPAHPILGVLHYRVEYGGAAFVFATDVESAEDGDPVLSEFARGADLLAHDVTYTRDEYYDDHPPKKGFGHSTWQQACATGKEAGVARLALIHHAPEHDDTDLDAMAAEAGAGCERTFLAHQGQVVDLL